MIGRGYVLSFGTFVALIDVKFHFLSFGEGLVAVCSDGGVVNKDFSAFLSLDEPESLRVIEPFDSSKSHSLASLG